MLDIVWTCCTATVAGKVAKGSWVDEGSHAGGRSTGILRAEGESVKAQNTEQWKSKKRKCRRMKADDKQFKET